MGEKVLQIKFDEYNEKKENLLTKTESIYVDLNSKMDTGELISNVVDGYMECFDNIKIIMDKYIQLLKKDVELMNLTREGLEEAERRNVNYIENIKEK